MAWTHLRKSTCSLGSQASHSTTTARIDVLTHLTAAHRGCGGEPTVCRQFFRAESVLFWGRAFLLYIDLRLDRDPALSLLRCCLWLSHSPWLDLLFRSELSWLLLRPGCQRQRWAVRAHPPPSSRNRPSPASADSMACQHPGLERTSTLPSHLHIARIYVPGLLEISTLCRLVRPHIAWHVRIFVLASHSIVHIPYTCTTNYSRCRSFLCDSSQHRLALLRNLFITDRCSMCPGSPTSPSSYPYT